MASESAKRWLTLYPRRDDFYRLREKSDALELYFHSAMYLDLAARWETLTETEEASFFKAFAAACLELYCDRDRESLAQKIQSSAAALEYLQPRIKQAHEVYESFFQIRKPYSGAKVSIGPERDLDVRIYLDGISSKLNSAISTIVGNYWNESRVLNVNTATWGGVYAFFHPSERPLNMVNVSLQDDVIASLQVFFGSYDLNLGSHLDFNEPRTSFVVAHEFGHIFGFPDCYIEYWQEEEQAFVYYILDPQNIMCATTGTVLDQHRREIIRAYSANH